MLTNDSPPPPPLLTPTPAIAMTAPPHTKSTILSRNNAFPNNSKGRLLKLVVENFKSYSSTQTIGPFDHNFISIIGPNGAGKSNLMDAISFVLGIHSMHLRSTSLKDLIYRPTSPSSLAPTSACVEAHYLRSNGDLIIFKRIIETSSNIATSSYFINDMPISWKDYTEEWEKENILIKARNFLVFQGDVEALANKGPAQLTSLIEDISGSSSLQGEWSTLQGQLQEAQERSNDAFTKRRTISSELKAVEEQKQDVIEWQKISSDLSHHILSYSKKKLLNSALEKKTLLKNVDDLSNSLKFLETLSQEAGDEETLRDKRVELALRTKEILELERSLTSCQQNLHLSLEPKLRSSSSFLEMTKQREERIINGKQREKESIECLSLSLHDLEGQFMLLLEEKERLEKNFLLEKNEKIKEGQRILMDSSIEKEVFLSQYMHLLRESQLLCPEERLKLESLTCKDIINSTKREASRAHLSSLKGALLGIGKKISTLKGRIERLERKRSLEESQRLRSQISHHQEREESLIERAKIISVEISSLTNKLLIAGEQKGEIERSSFLARQLERLESLMGANLIWGRLSSLVKMRDSRWDPTLRSLLGHHYDSIVVKDHHVAKRAIECLRDLSLGTATFLPLDSLKIVSMMGGIPSHTATSSIGNIVNALKSLSFRPEIERALLFVVGQNTLLASTLKDVIGPNFSGIKVVCLDGSIQHSNGFVSGLMCRPTSRTTTTTISNSTLKELQDKRDVLQREEAKISEELRMQNPSNDWIIRLEELQREEEAIIAEIGESQTMLTSSMMEENHLLLEIDAEEARSSLIGLGDGLREEIFSLRQKISSQEEILFQPLMKALNTDIPLQKFVSEYIDGGGIVGNYSSSPMSSSSSSSSSPTRLDELNIILKRIHDQKNLLTRQMETKKEILKEMEEKVLPNISELESNLSKDSILLREERERIQAIHDKRDNLNQILKDCRNAEMELRLQRDSRRQEIKSLRGEIISRRSLLDRRDLEEEEIKRWCHHEQIPLSPTFLTTSSYDVLEDEKNDNAAAAITSYPGNEESWKAEERIMRERLDALAPSLRPLERLQEAGQRLKEDLVRLEGERGELKLLRDSFSSCKKKRASIFMEAFNSILLSLDPIYKSLTGGGGGAFMSLVPLISGKSSASDLSLLDDMDDEQPYLLGTTFHAMPPMKRFLEMDQLSGGERSMAALALLFSIHAYRPSPFFILDEVDAALDLSNIRRMVGYLRSRRDDCQFLMISLKRELYESSDSLVGIYVDHGDGDGDGDNASSRTLQLDLTVYDE